MGSTAYTLLDFTHNILLSTVRLLLSSYIEPSANTMSKLSADSVGKVRTHVRTMMLGGGSFLNILDSDLYSLSDQS